MVDGFINFNLNEKTPTIIKVIGVGGEGLEELLALLDERLASRVAEVEMLWNIRTRKGSVMSILSFVIQIIRRSATVRFLVKFSWGKS